jgi:uncharacterized protein (TIGR03437 family)
VDSAGNLYIADLNNNAVREVTGGVIKTVAGSGLPGVGGDGGPATAALVGNPTGIAVDSSGSIYIASGSATVRKVFAGTGFITTIAGNGTRGYSGDGGSAVFGELNGPIALAVASNNGNGYIADSANNAIRMLTGSGFQLSIAAAVNAASNLVGAVSAGEEVVLYGSGMGPAGLTVNQPASNGLYPTTLAGVTVYFGSYQAPILYVSPTQTAVVAPLEVSGATSLITVQYQGQFSSPFPVSIAQSTPGIYSANLSGQGEAASVNDQNGVFSYNSAAHPANAGDYVELFLTGIGPTSPTGSDGQPYAGFAPCALQVSVTIGGATVSPEYCGGIPGVIPGLTQINLLIPSGLPAGQVPLSVKAGGVSTQPGMTLAVSGH